MSVCIGPSVTDRGQEARLAACWRFPSVRLEAASRLAHPHLSEECFQKQVHGQQQPPVQCYVHPPITAEHIVHIGNFGYQSITVEQARQVSGIEAINR